MNNGNNQLDTTVEIVTPENVLLQYQLSGPFRRLLAYLIDVLVRIGVFIVVSIAVGLIFGFVGFGGFAVAISFVLYFFLTWFYGGLLEAYWNGQTIGKRVMGIRVLTLNGQPINALQAILRNFLREFDSLTIFYVPLAGASAFMGIPFCTYLVGFISMICTRRFQRVGDLACGTMVVVEQRRWHHGLIHTDDADVIQLASLLPANLELSRSLGQTLSHYVERRRVFPPARRADLSRHVGVPLCRRFGLPPDTNHDVLLCALYYRTFISDQLDEDDPRPLPAKSTELPPLPIAEQPSGDDIASFPEIQTPSITSRSISSRHGGSS